MCHDALHREESCGSHFRESTRPADGEAKRDDERFGYVAAWEFACVGKAPVPAQGAARFRGGPALRNGLQVNACDAARLAAAGAGARGSVRRYDMTDVSPDMSFSNADVLNQQLLARKDDPIAFDHDCREGICGCAAW